MFFFLMRFCFVWIWKVKAADSRPTRDSSDGPAWQLQLSRYRFIISQQNALNYRTPGLNDISQETCDSHGVNQWCPVSIHLSILTFLDLSCLSFRKVENIIMGNFVGTNWTRRVCCSPRWRIICITQQVCVASSCLIIPTSFSAFLSLSHFFCELSNLFISHH